MKTEIVETFDGHVTINWNKSGTGWRVVAVSKKDTNKEDA